MTEAIKLAILRGFSALCRLPVMRGRVTCSNFLYEWCRPKSTIVQRHVGSLRVELDLSDLESRYIYFSAYERAEVRFLRAWLKPGDIAVDIGAHIGYLSAVMASVVGPGGRVYAIEADPRNYARLKVAEASSRGVLQAYHVAAAETSSLTYPLYLHPTHSMWSAGVNALGKKLAEPLRVEAISFDQFVALHGLRRVDLVKIDVDGTEPHVLRGMQGYLASGGRPIVLCELVPKIHQILGIRTREVLDLLLRHGYRMLSPRGLVEISAQQIDEADWVNVLFNRQHLEPWSRIVRTSCHTGEV